jgi:hypothetical protein
MTRLSTRRGGRRPKSAKARSRGKWGIEVAKHKLHYRSVVGSALLARRVEKTVGRLPQLFQTALLVASQTRGHGYLSDASEQGT